MHFNPIIVLFLTFNKVRLKLVYEFQSYYSLIFNLSDEITITEKYRFQSYYSLIFNVIENATAGLSEISILL